MHAIYAMVLQVGKGQKSQCGTSVARVHKASLGIEGFRFGVIRIHLRMRVMQVSLLTINPVMCKTLGAFCDSEYG